MEESEESSFRSRSNTWPLNRICESESGDFATNNASHANDNCANLSSNDSAIGLSGESIATHHTASLEAATTSLLPSKKVSSRRNAWGNASYAELITQAINNSPDKRLTLSQIYEWMVQNVPYFKDKGDSNSSAGWKNSIRHNLSLHNRFMRVQNEGTGKSSWWVINPDAKPGKAARRRAASMETSKFEKKRGRVKRKLEAVQSGIKFVNASPSSSISEGLDTFPESPIHSTHFTLSPETFRPRASSNASSCGPLTPMPGDVDAQVPPLSPSTWNSSDITDPQQPSAHYSGDQQQPPPPPPHHQHPHQPHHNHQQPHADHQLAEMTYHSMNLGGNSTSAIESSYISLGSSDASDCNQVSPASSQLTLTSSNFGFGSNLSVNSSGGCGGPSSLRRNDSDPYFQSSAGIDATITLSTLNGSSNNNSSSTSSNLPSNGSNVNLHLSNTINNHTMSPSLSPAQSMDTLVGHLNSSFTSSHLEPIQRKRAFTYTFATHRPNLKDGSILNGQSVSQVMGQLLSINNSLPNDLDFESIQGGLECDVNSVIQHELSVEGNLDFNFDPLSAAKNHANTPVSTSMAGVHSHSWVH